MRNTYYSVTIFRNGVEMHHFGDYDYTCVQVAIAMFCARNGISRDECEIVITPISVN